MDQLTPGKEDNLHALPCTRCGEVMLHFCRVEADYPLCILWQLECGECGQLVQAWEDRDTPVLMAGMGYEGEDCLLDEDES